MTSPTPPYGWCRTHADYHHCDLVPTAAAVAEARFAAALERIMAEVNGHLDNGTFTRDEAETILEALTVIDDRRAAEAKRAWAEANDVELITPEIESVEVLDA